MFDCKPISTTIVVQEHKVEIVADFTVVSSYQIIVGVGSLQSLTIMWPDISFTVNTIF